MSRSTATSPERVAALLIGGSLLGFPFGVGAQTSEVDLTQGMDKITAALSAARPQAGETLLLGLSVNGVPQDGMIRALRVSTPDGLGLAVPQQLWDELHLRLPLQPPRLIDGEVHVVLGSDGDWRWHIDEASQTLMIDAPATAFRGQRMDMDAPAARVRRRQRRHSRDRGRVGSLKPGGRVRGSHEPDAGRLSARAAYERLYARLACALRVGGSALSAEQLAYRLACAPSFDSRV